MLEILSLSTVAFVMALLITRWLHGQHELDIVVTPALPREAMPFPGKPYAPTTLPGNAWT